MITISAKNLNKSFGIESILEEISFTVNKGDKVGLIGKNGSGKSTLFKMLTGLLPSDSGTLFIPKEMRLGYLEQTPDFDNVLTIKSACAEIFKSLMDMEERLHELEHSISSFKDHHDPSYEKTLEQYSNLRETFEEMNGYGYRSEIRGVLIGLGFQESEFDKPVNTLSGGQKSRLNIARLLLAKPDILMLDEPTNHLDIGAINWLEGYLKNYENSVLLISHDRYFIDQVANRIFEIENKHLLSHNGKYSDFVKFKKNLQEMQMKRYLESQSEIEKQQEIVRRFKQHGTEKLAKRAASREKKLDKIERIEKPEFMNDKASIRFKTQITSGKDVLFAKDISKSFAGRTIFKNIEFDIYRNDKVGLIGPNGIGKTTLFKILLGQLKPDTGEIKHGHNVHFGYYDQELQGLHDENNIFEEIASENPHLSNTEIRTMLGSFLFYGDDVFKSIHTLSGGEKGRISLLKLMQSKSNMLLLDEPTNHLDIPSKEALEDALSSYEGTFLAISHDRYFLNRVCDRIFDMSEDNIVSYMGNYDDYLEKKLLLEELSEEDAAPIKTKTQIKDERKRQKEQEKLLREEKRLLQNIESKIAAAEEEKANLEDMMCLNEVSSNFEKMQKLSISYEELEKTLKNLYEEWESLI
jgi:ATP-binding cassette subfamily F protein 3